MSANDTLAKLVSQIDIEERLALLEKIRKSSPLSLEPLYAQKDAAAQRLSFEEHYRNLPWILRLFYFIAGLFTGRSAAKVYENGRMLAMARRIEVDAPGVFDYKRNLLLDGFYVHLAELKDAARFFYGVLDTGINKDRGAFYATLGSLEMKDIHLRLQGECGPQALLRREPETQPSALRQAVLRAMDETLQSISDSRREAMYSHARSLGCLKELSCFLFDRFILAFDNMPTGHACRINAPVRELLSSLDSILFSLRDHPQLPLFESLFVYELETRAGEPGFDMDGEMASLLDRANKALETIRAFNSKIPLAKIIRCAAGNMGYFPAQMGGGEDWFQVYRGYWKHQLESDLEGYFAEKRRRDISQSLEDFFGSSPKPLANAASDENPNGFPLPEAFALSFLAAFNIILHGNINNVLRFIIMEGEFAKREDLVSMTEAYNNVMYAAERVQALDDKIAPNGEHGKRYAMARQEAENLHVKRRKMQFVQNDASKEAWDIISNSSGGMGKMIELLEVMGLQDVDGQQGGLANFDKLAGKTPAVFTRSIDRVVSDLRRALKALDDISAMGKAGS